jgi:hypothetical protein
MLGGLEPLAIDEQYVAAAVRLCEIIYGHSRSAPALGRLKAY